MKLIIIDRKAWERHCSDFADFVHRIEQLIGNPPETDEWLDNEAVCRRLGISKRTLQSYRDTRVCQNVHILFFMHKAPTFSSQGFAIS